jgi:hypothetical protein
MRGYLYRNGRADQKRRGPIGRFRATGLRFVVVVSAISREFNRLISLAGGLVRTRANAMGQLQLLLLMIRPKHAENAPGL